MWKLHFINFHNKIKYPDFKNTRGNQPSLDLLEEFAFNRICDVLLGH